MQARTSHAAAVVVLGIFCTAVHQSAAACPVRGGERVVLASQELDPDVFLWDSRDRLMKYAEGDYDVQMVLKHTTLVRAYSRAFVVGCRNTAIRPAFAGSADPVVDLVGVRVTSGPSRGRFGWVLSTDVRNNDGSALSAAGRR
jgi:hypothetical protein